MFYIDFIHKASVGNLKSFFLNESCTENSILKSCFLSIHEPLWCKMVHMGNINNI